MKTRVFVQQVHGANYPGTERCVASLVNSGLEERLSWLKRLGIDVEFAGALVDETDGADLPDRLEVAASDLSREASRLLILGSDHSMTTSVLRGLAAGNPGKTLGVIHFDAHCDLEDAARGNAHASVISAVTGLSPSSRVAVRPEHVVQIGIRDFSRLEAARVSHLRRVISANEVSWGGIARAVEGAYQDLASDVDSIYVTVDLDVIAIAEFPAVNTPKPGGGLSVAQVSAALQYLFDSRRVIGGDLVEYNPSNDDSSANGAKTVFELVASAVGYQRLLSASPRMFEDAAQPSR